MTREETSPIQPGEVSVREAVMSFLRSRGCTRMFGNPGSTELPLFRDFPEDFHYILALQEAVAVGMADGYAQATAKPTCVNLHSAAGTGNAMGAIFTAWCNRTPLIIIAGQQARSLLLHDPFLMSHHATQLVQPYVKFRRPLHGPGFTRRPIRKGRYSFRCPWMIGISRRSPCRSVPRSQHLPRAISQSS
jgi:thiamine pyrophosphate-dependent acetolactate synthase large subunit-like protein